MSLPRYNNYKMSGSGFFFLMCLSIYTLIIITPILGAKIGIWVYSAAGLFLLLSTLVYKNYVGNSSGNPLLVFVLLMAQIIIYKAVGFSTCTWGRVFSYGVTYFTLLLIPLFLSNKSLIIDIYYVVVFTIITVANIIDNIRLLILYPGASEAINFEWGEQFRSMNIGGTQFVCFVMLFGLFLLLLLRSIESLGLIKKLGLVCLFIISLVYILMSGRAMALLSFLIGSLLIVFYSNNYFRKHRALVLLAFVGVIFLFVIYIKEISYILELYLESDRLSSRLQEAASLGTSDVSSGSGKGRIDFYLMSIKTLFESPFNFLLGVGDEIADVPIMNKKGIGGHSGFFDFAAEYGLIGVVLLTKLLLMSFNMTYKKLKRIMPASIIVFLVFIVNGFINNPLTVSSLALIYIIIPSVLFITKVKKEESGKTVQ